MKEWKGTKGEAFFRGDTGFGDHKGYYILVGDKNKGWGKWIGEAKFPNLFKGSEQEALDNAELITDAFNTMNKCGIMPSELLELLKECSDVLEYTVNGHLYLEMDKQQAVYEKISRCTGK